METIAILTSGGDAPGMNAAIRAAVRSATARGLRVVGYEDGYRGVVQGRFVELDDRAVGNIIHRGGTVLGTSRCPEFLDPAVRAAAAERMRAAGIGALIAIGGDGTFRGARALESEHGIRVVGIPGTIDNDVWGTEETIGFDTAVNTAVRAIDQVRDTSESTGMMFFVEVMGRTAGAIALHTGVAAGAASVIVPEAHEDPEELAARIRTAIARGKRSHIVVVAEGDESGGAYGFAKRFEAVMPEQPYRILVLGHIQRGGSPTARDRIIASLSGAAAVEAVAAGRSGVMIGIQCGRPVEVPLGDVVSQGEPPVDFGLLQLAQSLAG